MRHGTTSCLILRSTGLWFQLRLQFLRNSAVFSPGHDPYNSTFFDISISELFSTTLNPAAVLRQTAVSAQITILAK